MRRTADAARSPLLQQQARELGDKGELRNAEVYGVELKCYGRDEKTRGDSERGPKNGICETWRGPLSQQDAEKR